MYTIQNAFDGNPATAYVENTDDDLFRISIVWNNKEFSENAVQSIKIINGYAKNKSLFFANNRIKEINHYAWKNEKMESIAIADHDYDICINLMEGSGTFSVIDVYSGEKYSDTCISEIDYYFVTSGWLFGN